MGITMKPIRSITIVVAALFMLVLGLSALGNHVAEIMQSTSAGLVAVGAAYLALNQTVVQLFGHGLSLGSTLLTFPRLASVGDPAGCSLTNMKFQPLTPDVIEGMDMTAYEEEIWSRITESRMVGVVPNTLHELLMSRITPVDKGEMAQRKVGRTTDFAPFKYRERERNMAMSYFNVSAGEAAAGAGTGGVPASAWRLTVNIGPGEYASKFKYLARYFIAGQHIVVEHKNVSTEVAYTTAHKILSATDVNADSAYVTVSAPYTDTQWAALSSSNKAIYQPEHGAVQVLANDTSDWESGASNAPTNNNRELIVDWFQTSRETRVRNQEYEDALNNILEGKVNSYLSKFRYLPTAERNKQEMAYWQQIFLNAAFYNGRVANQTTDPTWADIEALEEVRDPEDTDCLYERKAHALGLHTQLVENSRRLDLQGAALDFDLLFEVFQKMRRVRRLDGKEHPTIDVLLDRFTKHDIDTLLVRYLTLEYGVTSTRFIEHGKVKDTQGVVMFEYTVYDLPKQHMRIGLFAHPFFEDRISAFGDGSGSGNNGSVNLKNRARMMMALDWEDINIGVIETNTVKREYKNEVTAQANSLYTTRMKINTKEFDLRSTTWDVEIGDFDRHLIIENFSDACPTVTISACVPASS